MPTSSPTSNSLEIEEDNSEYKDSIQDLVQQENNYEILSKPRIPAIVKRYDIVDHEMYIIYYLNSNNPLLSSMYFAYNNYVICFQGGGIFNLIDKITWSDDLQEQLNHDCKQFRAEYGPHISSNRKFLLVNQQASKFHEYHANMLSQSYYINDEKSHSHQPEDFFSKPKGVEEFFSETSKQIKLEEGNNTYLPDMETYYLGSVWEEHLKICYDMQF